MIENILRYKFNKSTNVNLLKSDKFKTNTLAFQFKRRLTLEEASKGALLTGLLTSSNKDFKTKLELNRELFRLYGSSIDSEITKHGDLITIDFRMSFPNDKYISETIVRDSINLLYACIYKPLLIDGIFKDELFKLEKQNLVNVIKSRIVDKMRYANDRCIEIMCMDEAFSIYKYGDEDAVSNITNKELVDYYNTIINHSELDITIIGSIDFDEVKGIIDGLSIPENDFEDISLGYISKNIEQVKNIEEEMKLSQGKLNIGFRTNVNLTDDDYYGLVLFSHIYGGGASSYLFRNVREKESLCYYIYSRLEAFKGLMLVGSGIESNKFEKTRDMILKGLDSIKSGEFSDGDIEISKRAIIKSLDSIGDSQGAIMVFNYNQIIARGQYNIDKYKDKILSCSKEDIINAGKNIELDTVYFLS